MSKDTSDLQRELSLALSQVRTEYSPEQEVFDMFSLPVYWGQLHGLRPCFLVGGRGTGKTTTLKGLTYGGQFALHGADIGKWQTIGVYWRLDSNVVRAFHGRQLDRSTWSALFGHYVNLQLVSRILTFVLWREENLHTPTVLTPDDLALVSASLHMDEVPDVAALRRGVRLAMARFEASLNGPAVKLLTMDLSALGRPVGYLIDAFGTDEALADKHVTFCLDEFENLDQYQQEVINTLIKHSGDSRFTFTIGVRDNAQRSRSTLVDAQPLTEPADYTSVNIVEHLKEQVFSRFAAQVCSKRLARLPISSHVDMTSLLPGLSSAEEAALLGIDLVNTALRQRLILAGTSSELLVTFDGLSALEKYLVEFWGKGKVNGEIDSLTEAASNPQKWKTKANNYSHAMLFSIRQGKRGIVKYYTGWSVYTQMADGNIRHVLQLAYEALIAHLRDGHDLSEPVSSELQTQAAIRVGETAVRELQGISGRGGQIMKLTLSLGRIFGVMAADPHGHAPEVNQFRITKADTLLDDVLENEAVLAEAVGHGALVAFDGDKNAKESGSTKAPDFRLHPIFAAYFTYTHRQKRRISITDVQIAQLYSDNPAPAIKQVLRGRGTDGAENQLPEQLEIYERYLL